MEPKLNPAAAWPFPTGSKSYMTSGMKKDTPADPRPTRFYEISYEKNVLGDMRYFSTNSITKMYSGHDSLIACLRYIENALTGGSTGHYFVSVKPYPNWYAEFETACAKESFPMVLSGFQMLDAVSAYDTDLVHLAKDL
jgi:hypothetical protein